MFNNKLSLLAGNPRLIGKLCEILGEMPNVEFPTMGGHFFWDTFAEVDGWKFQRNKITGHCRILDPNDIRKAWGSESAMSKALERLEDAPEKMINEFNNVNYGDVIGVDRGVYQHYGVYVADECVIHYASESGDFFGGEICIHKTTLESFIGNSCEFFVCKFPKEYGEPSKLNLSAGFMSSAFASQWINIIKLLKEFNYKLYSPEETVKRALSRLGENKYNLALNNCEHFAIWCKTGISESHQVNSILAEIPITQIVL